MAGYNPYATNSYQETQMFQHWYDDIERKIKKYS